MMFRGISIFAALAATVGLWFAYDELTVFRRTMFWDYRYLIFGIGALLALSVTEVVLGWIKAKTRGDTNDH